MASQGNRQLERTFVPGEAHRSDQDEKVILNIGGFRHETLASNIRSAPDTRLHWVVDKNVQSPEYDATKGEYFFDRNPLLFPYILNFYRTGKLHCPPDICSALFQEELQFWGIDEYEFDSCCWMKYKKNQDADLNLQNFEGADDNTESSVQVQPVNNESLEIPMCRDQRRIPLIYEKLKKLQAQLWLLLEEPQSSSVAQIAGFLSIFFIVVSVSTFCAETMPYFEDHTSMQYALLNSIETTCVTWFTAEFAARFASCPSKPQFLKNVMNWIDLCAILPYFVVLGLSSNVKTIAILRVIRLIRVFRIFKLSRHSYGLQVLGHTLKSSCRELFLLVFFLSIGVVIFSSLVFYAEKDHNGGMFPSIPSAFWWSVVTMTTVGYGDVVPRTLPGKLVGTLCALCGVLVIALPVPVVVSNFSLYYSHAQAKLRCSDKRRGDLNRKSRRMIGFLQPWFSAEPTHRSSIISVYSRSNYPMSPTTPLSPSYRRFPQQANGSPNLLSPKASNPPSPMPAAFPRINARGNFCGSPIFSSTQPPMIVTNLPSPMSGNDKNLTSGQMLKEKHSNSIFINILPPSQQNSDQSSVTADSGNSNSVFSFSPQSTDDRFEVCKKHSEFNYDRSFLTPSTCTFQWSTATSPQFSESSPLSLSGYTAGSSETDTSFQNTPSSKSSSPCLLLNSNRMGRRNGICVVSHTNEPWGKRIFQKGRAKKQCQPRKCDSLTPASITSSCCPGSTTLVSDIYGTKSPGVSASLWEVTRRLVNAKPCKEVQQADDKAEFTSQYESGFLMADPLEEIPGTTSTATHLRVDGSEKRADKVISLESVESSSLCRRRQRSRSDLSDQESKFAPNNNCGQNIGSLALLTSASQSKIDTDEDAVHLRPLNLRSNHTPVSTSSAATACINDCDLPGEAFIVPVLISENSICPEDFRDGYAPMLARKESEPRQLSEVQVSVDGLSSPATAMSAIEISVGTETFNQTQESTKGHSSMPSISKDNPAALKISRSGLRADKDGHFHSFPALFDKAEMFREESVCTKLSPVHKVSSAPGITVRINGNLNAL